MLVFEHWKNKNKNKNTTLLSCNLQALSAMEEKFEDTKVVIKVRKSEKDR